jgi:signal transduction histidine kinase
MTISAALGDAHPDEPRAIPRVLPRPVAARASRVAILLLILASVAGAWVLAAALSREVMEGATAAGLDRARADALATEHFARQTIESTRLMRDLAIRWQSLDGTRDPLRRADAEAMLHALLRNPSTPIAQFGITDAGGSVTWHSAGGHADFSVAERDHFLRHKAGHPGPILGRPSPTRDQLLPLSWRLTSPDGSFSGVAIALMRPADLAPMLAAITGRPADLTAMARLEGELLTASHRADHLIGATALPEPMRHRLQHDGSWEGAAPAIPGGRPRLIAARLVSGTNLVVVGGVDAAQSLAEAQLLQGAAFLAALGYTGFVVLCGALALVAERARAAMTRAAMLDAGRAEVHRLHAKLPAVVFLREVDADGTSRLTYRAGDVRTVTGWEDGSLDGVEDWSHLYDEAAPPREAMVRRVLRDGSAKLLWRIRQPDGGWRPVVMRMERLSRRADGGGEIVGYLRDATAEQAALDRAAAMRAELDDTLALAPVVVFRARAWTCSACHWRQGRGCYREDYVSGSLEQVTGWTRDALAAAGGLAAVITPFDSVLEGIEAMKRDGAWSADLTLSRPDGGSIVVRMTTRVVGRPDDTALDFVGYLADVTAEHDAKVQAITSARLASLGEVSAGLAHELKQPLQAIGLAVANTQQAAARGEMTAVQARLGRVAGYVTRATAVVEHLRRFARGTDDGAAAVAVPVDRALEGALAVLGSTLRDAGVELRLTLGDPAPVVLGQLVPLEQVLVNLIGNARDALRCQESGWPRQVAVTAVREGAVVLLTIADNGGGIPAVVMPRLFQPFVTTKPAEQGTGLGLSICQGLVRQMGGSIEAANENGGAVFRIRLPAFPPAA